MDDDETVCSSLLFHLTNESDVIRTMDEFALIYDKFFVGALLYAGPVIVLANIFVIFILTRKELRTSYNVIFIVMALNQGLTILGRNMLHWKTILAHGCDRYIHTLPSQLFEVAIQSLCPILAAHVSWLAVIVTFVRLRHLTSSNMMEPSTHYMIVLCCTAFVLILVASIPLFATIKISWMEVHSECANEEPTIERLVFVEASEMLFEHDCLLLRFLFISSGFLFNTLPCIMLAFLSSALVFRLRKIHKNRVDLVVGSSSAAARTKSTRSSLMIVLIVFTTLVTNVPQAVVNILVGFMSDHFRYSVAPKLNSLIITLVMVSSAINLAIQLCMSCKFREGKRLLTGSLTSRHPLHQDFQYFPFRPADFVVCAWTAMQTINRANGCLVVVPGTHKGHLHPHGYPDWKEHNAAYHGIQDYDPSMPRTYVEMESGDTVFFHPLTIHGSGANRTDGYRRAISCHYANDDLCRYYNEKTTSQEETDKDVMHILKTMIKKHGLDLNPDDIDYSFIYKIRSRAVNGEKSNL